MKPEFLSTDGCLVALAPKSYIVTQSGAKPKKGTKGIHLYITTKSNIKINRCPVGSSVGSGIVPRLFVPTNNNAGGNEPTHHEQKRPDDPCQIQ